MYGIMWYYYIGAVYALLEYLLTFVLPFNCDYDGAQLGGVY